MERIEQMIYQEVRQYLKSIPINRGQYCLENMRELMRRLGNPENQLKIVHVAGTNGKGSVISYIESVLQTAGYMVGKYISPSVFTYLEKIQRDKKEISENEFANYASKVISQVEDMLKDGFSSPSPFEIETATAFLYFANVPCDLVLLETGMGGILDATNIESQVICSVITSISYDHMDVLGHTLIDIAHHKAGIIKERCPVVLYHQMKEVEEVIKTEAFEKHAPCMVTNEVTFDEYCSTTEEERFFYQSVHKKKYEISLQMLGNHQVKNACVAIETIEQIIEAGYVISDECIKDGLRNAHWSGRFEKIWNDPKFYIDGAHNPDAAEVLKRTLFKCCQTGRRYFIMGIFADKDYKVVIEKMAPLADMIFAVTPRNERGLSNEILEAEIKKVNEHVVRCEIEEAVTKAFLLAKEEDTILAFGTLSVLGDIRACVLGRNKVG